jgi:glycine/D-amino acid oxidase-like deaminating enzyme
MRGDRHGVEMAVGTRRVRASWGVVATGYATGTFKPLAGRFRLVDTYVMATPRLSPRMRAAVGLGDAMVWDTAKPYHYLRWTPDHRLLFGGADRLHRSPTRRTVLPSKIEELRRDLAAFYPQLSGIAPEFAWEGLFATTPDGLPYIGTHRRYPRHLFALGYGGNGMTFSFLAARVLTRLIAGRAHSRDAFFSFSRQSSWSQRS